MTRRAKSTNNDRPLPLTERALTSPRAEVVSEADIRRLVDAFYDTVRDDDLIGPIFERRVANWSHHLPKMYDFWSTVVLHSARYSGRPIEVHRVIAGLSPAHFERWLSLWEATVARVIDRPARDAFVQAARRMASSMSTRLT